MDKRKISNNASTMKINAQSKNNVNTNSKNIVNMNSKDTVVDCSASKSNSILSEREKKDGPGGE